MLRHAALALMVAFAPVTVTGTETVPVDAQAYYDILADTLYADDRNAMKGWEEQLRAQLDAVAADPMDAEIAAWAREIRALLDADRLPIADDAEFLGNWRVRSMQVDDLGAFVYSWFPARVFREARALVFDKDSGSQRHRGLMALEPNHRFYLFAGALYYGYEEERFYSAHMGEDAPNADRDMDAVARVYKLGPEHFMMAFAPDDGRYRLYEIRR
ncbi:DUF4893 domain-containing protein [Pelagibacterium xiamenense]|uniref:DUF4893 domain-containing protein n=1 Tax=Pelagibacterium xiamenense TaxID=2901140 RepID=UPI001E4A4975|nr:DUF4893 domain-containing protein [Pelagibacterium xiamenense]MCD7058726.1 DUF4893 domain-containing protein [Pelagibacterium xiamenense]